MKWFNLQRKEKPDGDLSGKDSKAMLALLGKLLSEIADDLNANLQDESAKLAVGKPVATEDLEDGKKVTTTRIFVSNKSTALSVRARGTAIELFLLPASQLYLVPSSEYSSRLKFKLVRTEEQAWSLDGKETCEADMKLLLLTVTNDLIKHSAKTVNPAAPGVRLRIGDLSLTTGLRDLLFEKAQLLSDLVDRQESLKFDIRELLAILL